MNLAAVVSAASGNETNGFRVSEPLSHPAMIATCRVHTERVWGPHRKDSGFTQKRYGVIYTQIYTMYTHTRIYTICT